MAVSNYNPGQELSSIDFRSMIGGPLTSVVEAQAQAALSTVDFIKSVGFEPDAEDETTGEIIPGGPRYVHFKYPKQVAPYIAAKNGVINNVTPLTVTDANSIDSIVINSNVGGSGANIVGVVNGSDEIVLTIQDGGEGYDNADTITVTYTSTANSTETVTTNLTTTNLDAVPAQFEEMQLEVPLLTMVPIPFIKVDEAEIDFNAKINSMDYRRVGSEFKAGSSLNINNKTKGSFTAGTGTIASLFAKASSSLKFTNTVNFKVYASYKRTTKQGSKVEKTFQLGVKVKASQDETPGGMEKILNILEDSIIGLPVIQ